MMEKIEKPVENTFFFFFCHRFVGHVLLCSSFSGSGIDCTLLVEVGSQHFFGVHHVVTSIHKVYVWKPPRCKRCRAQLGAEVERGGAECDKRRT